MKLIKYFLIMALAAVLCGAGLALYQSAKGSDKGEVTVEKEEKVESGEADDQKEEGESENRDTTIQDQGIDSSQQSDGTAPSSAGTTGGKLTAEDAAKIALRGLDGKIEKIKLKEKDDGAYYKVKIVGRSGFKEAKMEIDAYTGAVLSVDIDD
ncbi:PepSY domain-containing protein [Kroppenstedtia pulmonis]|uniref:PepSY domain-containing protein n=1 Tax=Kroppenstedtia pulmonis TaxID=1380685 RepID=A0A7D4C5E2_9BACL|nr:PepSY domain-containing protein [Kroppenstedtia pulmonis]QKG83736.1 PepSY domain-containing protein [Kroppenstedtia pulmonis]